VATLVARQAAALSPFESLGVLGDKLRIVMSIMRWRRGEIGLIIGGSCHLSRLVELEETSRENDAVRNPELVLLLVALGGMTAAASWAVIELRKPRR
jgi:hypothetical protein